MELAPNYQLYFSRQDEYAPNIVDMHERGTSLLSPVKTSYPLVSEYLVEKKHIVANYPENKKFAVCLTHDIDNLFFKKKEIIRQSIKSLAHHSFSQFSSSLSNFFNKNNSVLFNIEEIIDIEKKYNACSTFFFLSLEKNERDFNYSTAEIRDICKIITDNHCEIGLHAGHEAFADLGKLKKEKSKLESSINREVIGIRNHFLKFKNPGTWEIQSKAGFKYDATYGYNDAPGFRNGMCHPFTPYNIRTNKYIDIIEIPLTLMDCTLDLYMRLDYENSWKLIKQTIDKVESLGGVFTLLWHNTYFTENNLNLYIKILEYCSSKGAWLTSGEKIYKWWENNKINTKFYEYL